MGQVVFLRCVEVGRWALTDSASAYSTTEVPGALKRSPIEVAAFLMVVSHVVLEPWFGYRSSLYPSLMYVIV